MEVHRPDGKRSIEQNNTHLHTYVLSLVTWTACERNKTNKYITDWRNEKEKSDPHSQEQTRRSINMHYHHTLTLSSNCKSNSHDIKCHIRFYSHRRLYEFCIYDGRTFAMSPGQSQSALPLTHIWNVHHYLRAFDKTPTVIMAAQRQACPSIALLHHGDAVNHHRRRTRARHIIIRPSHKHTHTVDLNRNITHAFSNVTSYLLWYTFMCTVRNESPIYSAGVDSTQQYYVYK